MTFSIDYCPPWDWFHDALDDNERASIEAQEALIDAGDGLDG